jgi:gliding motility-associated-like protein
MGFKFKIIVLLITFLWIGAGMSLAQTKGVRPPHVINAAGGSAIVGGNYYGYNIGEPIITTRQTSTNYYTQGFLQPDYKIATAFNAGVYVFNESCQGAADGSIVTNAYNTKGKVQYILSPLASPGDTTATIVNLAPATYTFIIQDSINLPIQKVITIQPSSETCPIVTYHAFSPNSDGLNDLYIITGIENYPDNHVYFFNRWGTKVWDKAKYDNVKVVWDGKDMNGISLNPGTYFYVIDIDGKKPQKNWVEITK